MKILQSRYILYYSILFYLLYAILRYIVFGPVMWSELPLYVLNKSLALSALTLFAISPVNDGERREQLLATAGYLAALHGVISLILLPNGYYAKFFTDTGSFRIMAQVSLLGGAAAFGLWLRGIRVAAEWVLAMIGVHLFFMGAEGWFSVGKWYGYMPPMSLLGFFVVIGSLGYILKTKGRTVL